MNTFRRMICLLIIALLTAAGAGALAEELVLPGALRIIEAQAFEGWTGAERVVLPEGIEEIGSRAFADSSVKEINLPGTLSRIADDAFEGAALETVTAEQNTDAYKWAVKHGYIQPSGTISLEIECNATEPMVGDTLKWAVTATGGSGNYSYRYDIYRDGGLISSTGDTVDSEVTWTCDAAGSYHLVCVVTDGEATDVATSAAIQVEEAEALSAAIACDIQSAAIGDTAQWTVTASGGTGDYSFAFELYENGELLGKAAASDDRVMGHTFTEKGSYYVNCRVSDGQETVTVTSDTIEVVGGLSATITCSATKATVGKELKWTVNTTGTDCSYYFEVFRDKKKIGQTVVGDENFLTYAPDQAGTYYVTCRVTADGEVVNLTSKTIKITEVALAVSSLKVDASKFMTTETHTWTAAATGGKSPYRFSYALSHEGTQVDYQAFSTVKTYSYTFFQEGAYVLTVQVRDADNKTASKEYSFSVGLSGTTMTGVVRVYVDCDDKGNVKRSNSNTGHFELQINNDSDTDISFDNHVLTDPVFSYGKDSTGVSRTSGSSFRLYTFSFTTTADQVDALLNSELKDLFVDSATETFNGSTYNYSVVNNAFRTYQISSSNCFTAVARWCSLLGYGKLSAIQSSSTQYTDYIAWKLFEKMGGDWEYVRTVNL